MGRKPPEPAMLHNPLHNRAESQFEPDPATYPDELVGRGRSVSLPQLSPAICPIPAGIPRLLRSGS